jgi:hypothetical protein
VPPVSMWHVVPGPGSAGPRPSSVLTLACSVCSSLLRRPPKLLCPAHAMRDASRFKAKLGRAQCHRARWAASPPRQWAATGAAAAGAPGMVLQIYGVPLSQPCRAVVWACMYKELPFELILTCVRAG